jgi:hypothetical protein
MAKVTTVLGVALILAAFGSLWASLNLVPTEMGLLYGVSGVVLLGCGAIVLAIAALIARLGRLIPPSATIVAAPPPAAPLAVPASAAPRIEVNEAASPFPQERLAPEREPADGGASPQVIGRYAAGASSYVLFSDGAIEAETDAGAMRFASLDDFKSYVATRKR